MSIKFDHKDFDKFLKNFENLEKDYDLFCSQFLLKEAMKVLADTKALTPVKTGDLRNRWELTQVFKTAKGYYIQIFNSLEYASYVEDGHRQQVGRFVPGIFVGGKFVYTKGAKSGIVLKKPFVNGFHMCRIAIDRYDDTIKANFEAAFKAFYKGKGL